MARNHVHLVPAGHKEAATGSRKWADVGIYVDVGAAMEAGMKFFRSANNVILTRGLAGSGGTGGGEWAVPVRFFRQVVHIPTGEVLWSQGRPVQQVESGVNGKERSNGKAVEDDEEPLPVGMRKKVPIGALFSPAETDFLIQAAAVRGPRNQNKKRTRKGRGSARLSSVSRREK